MGLRISTNIAAISAERQLGIQQKRSQHAMQALSSGSRIVSASDDAAGLAISENLKATTRGLSQAKSNAFNAGSLVQTSEGGLNEISNILTRLKELGVQAASDGIGDTERGYINTESKQLVQEADRIAKTTRFGSRKLLDGSNENLEFQVGDHGDADNVIAYKITSNATASALGISGLSLEDKGSARDSLGVVDTAMEKLGKMRADFGAVQSRLDATTANLDVQVENISAANSRLRDADIAHETAELTSSNVLQAASASVLAQANSSPQMALKLIG